LKEEAGFIRRQSKAARTASDQQARRKNLFRQAEERLFQPRTVKKAEPVSQEKMRQKQSLLFMGETMRQIFTVVAQCTPNYETEEMEQRPSHGFEVWCVEQDRDQASRALGLDGDADADV
jgi:hypothetical protein